MRISDWSSDVCSSDLHLERFGKMFPADEGTELERALRALGALPLVGIVERFDDSMENLAKVLTPYFPDFKTSKVAANVSRDINVTLEERIATLREELGKEVYETLEAEIGRASCRERGCKYV